MSVPRSWREVRADVAARLGAHVVSAEAEARWLCESVSGHGAPEWDEIERTAPTARQATKIDALVRRRLAGEPLQYVLGEWSFRSLDLMVDPRVLIPRPETEWVVEVALQSVTSASALVADLGTGSGAIALSIAHERREWNVIATDVSADALAVARWNGAGNGIRNVEYHQGDWFDALPRGLVGSFDLIISNPPYVADAERGDLAPEVVDHEPNGALFAGSDGLDAIRVLVTGAPSWLRPGGVLVVEHAPSQADTVAALALDAGFAEVSCEPDLTGRPRAAVARVA
jgi:release factor glutamine methyltransferase